MASCLFFLLDEFIEFHYFILSMIKIVEASFYQLRDLYLAVAFQAFLRNFPGRFICQDIDRFNLRSAGTGQSFTLTSDILWYTLRRWYAPQF